MATPDKRDRQKIKTAKKFCQRGKSQLTSSALEMALYDYKHAVNVAVLIKTVCTVHTGKLFFGR